MVTILAVLALGLLVLCLVAKNVAMRWVRTIVNHREPTRPMINTSMAGAVIKIGAGTPSTNGS